MPFEKLKNKIYKVVILCQLKQTSNPVGFQNSVCFTCGNSHEWLGVVQQLKNKSTQTACSSSIKRSISIKLKTQLKFWLSIRYIYQVGQKTSSVLIQLC